MWRCTPAQTLMEFLAGSPCYLDQCRQSSAGFRLVRHVSLRRSCARRRCRLLRCCSVSLRWVSGLHQAVLQAAVVQVVLHVYQTVAVPGAVLHQVNEQTQTLVREGKENKMQVREGRQGRVYLKVERRPFVVAPRDETSLTSTRTSKRCSWGM